MRRSFLTQPPVIIAILILQLIPLFLFPAKSFSPTGQEWWLPILLVVMVLVADFQIIFRRSPSVGPWLLIGFAQGFNIISRLMMVWPNATIVSETGTAVNWTYLLLTIISMAISAWLLMYTEKPATRRGPLARLALMVQEGPAGSRCRVLPRGSAHLPQGASTQTGRLTRRPASPARRGSGRLRPVRTTER